MNLHLVMKLKYFVSLLNITRILYIVSELFNALYLNILWQLVPKIMSLVKGNRSKTT